MKKFVCLFLLLALVINLASCDSFGVLVGPGDGEQGGNVVPGDDVIKDNELDDGSNDNGGDDGDDKTDVVNPPSGDNINSQLISVTGLKGLNEQITIEIKNESGFRYNVYYKLSGEKEYVELDNNLVIYSGDVVNCYVLGIKKGNYDIKIEAEGDEIFASKTYSDIVVAAQDRSGYAHFNYSEGIGAYNDDGTVKEDAKIVYVTNDNKNTVTLEIDGVEYVGLVNILQAQYKSSTPMLIRVIGKISTNQWNYKNVAPRLADGSNADPTFFENTFSTEYGENLANLIVKMKGNGGGAKTYNYRTTPEGLTEVRLTNSGSSTVAYKGSDFPSLTGKTVYDDDSYYNMLEIKESKNITIEGVGAYAEFFQFGVSFEECSNIEIKNITFTDYPEDAINFLGGDRKDLANYDRYWVHSCTFNRGYNAWDISGERDKYAGDGSIDFNNVSSLTLSYNYFNNSKKSMLFGSGDSQACMNFTMHHNHFYKVESRLPLGRNVNIHSYNNYFDQCKNASDIRSSSYLFSENNYFYSTSKPFIISSSAVKSFGDIFDSSASTGATIVSDRTQLVSVNCKPDTQSNMSGFDTNSKLFYYNDEEKKTDVSIMHEADYVPIYVSTVAGAGYIGLITNE